MSITGGSVFGYFAYQAMQMVLHDPYYVEHAASCVVHYLEANNNRWPTSWDDLRRANPDRIISGPFSIEVLEQNVIIDWNASPSVLAHAKLRDDDQPPFRVIWLRNGKSIYWSSTEPNRSIWEYLQKHKDRLPQIKPE
ncbi:MAG TPA: hypothetical protein PLN21_21665 [Gemmatales bacterium]|nr:hypothetical protein [Gemmatales bacterium]